MREVRRLFSEIPSVARDHYCIEDYLAMTGTQQNSRRRFQRCFFIYILASPRGTLYVGLTDDLRKRMLQHKSGTFDGFTKRYKVDRLMYFEIYSENKVAGRRELQVKNFRREKKIALFS